MTSIKMKLSPHTARHFFNIIGAVVDEFRLMISKDSWKVSAVDKANVAIINIDLPKTSFQDYEFDITDNWTSGIDGHPTGVLEETLEAGVFVDMIKGFLGSTIGEKLHEPVEFSFSGDVEQYILTMIQGEFTRKLLLLKGYYIRSPPKRIVFPSDYCLQLSTVGLARVIEKAMKVSDYIALGFRLEEDNSMFFTAIIEDGNDQSWKAECHVNHWQVMCDKPRNSSSSLFSLDYLHDLVNAIPSENVRLYLGEDYPCRLSFKLGFTGQCEYMIAPRIKSE